MVWYNPFTWFSDDKQRDRLNSGERSLYCANPQCGAAFTREDTIAYDETNRVLTHPGDCQLEYACHRALREDGIVMGNFDGVSYEGAIRLAAKGKIDKVSLEAKVGEQPFSFKKFAQSD